MRFLLKPSRALLLSAILLAATASHASASWGEVYFNFYNAAKEEAQFQSDLSPELMEYVLSTMNNNQNNPMTLSASDVQAALRGEFFTLCQNQSETYTLSQCTQINEDIRYLVQSEKEIQALADDLLTIANSSELVAGDEAHRPNSFGVQTAAFSVIWTGTGASTLQWPEDDAVQDAWDNLEQALQSEGSNIEKVVARFHFGLFRILREEQAGWTELEPYGDQVRSALEELANVLDITQDNVGKEDLGEYATPTVSTVKNIAVWAREDDIGLNFIYPEHQPRFSVEIPRAYPIYYSGGTLTGGTILSYPYRYNAEELPELSEENVRKNLASPLCSRISGAHGYLCRSVEDASKNCPTVPDNDFAIHLITCGERETIINPGITVCSGANLMSQFDVRLNGQVVKPAPGQNLEVCTPGTFTTFDSSFVTNSCFVGFCLKQSFNEHSLVGGRNPIAVMESTSPYLSCMRPDPQLGMLGELPPVAATVLPQYIGHFAVQAFDHEQCERTGSPPGVSGVCKYRSNRTFAMPFLSFLASPLNEGQQALTDQAQAFLKDAATAIGQQYAVNQAVPVYEKLIKSLAQGVNAISDVILELQDAPLSTVACPWSGTLCNTQCNDGFDNDGDGKADLEDDTCETIQTPFE